MPTIIWSSSIAKDIYIRTTGDVQAGNPAPIVGVMSCTAVDVDNFDNEVYRDTSDIAYPFYSNKQSSYTVGDPAPIMWEGGAGGTMTESIEPLEKKMLLKSPESGAAVTTVIVPPQAAADGYITLDDRASHTPPKPVPKKDTILLWWSGINGTGSVLASCMKTEFVGTSTVPFTFI